MVRGRQGAVPDHALSDHCGPAIRYHASKCDTRGNRGGARKGCCKLPTVKLPQGWREMFCCPRDKIMVNRDVAGARNNFLSEYGRAVLVDWDGQRG